MNMRNKPNRFYLWLPSSADPNKESGGNITPPVALTLPDNRTPTHIWSLLYFGSEQLTPPDKTPLIHNDTALLESPLHDYRISGNSLIYRGRFLQGGVWLALEYKDQ